MCEFILSDYKFQLKVDKHNLVRIALYIIFYTDNILVQFNVKLRAREHLFYSKKIYEFVDQIINWRKYANAYAAIVY